MQHKEIKVQVPIHGLDAIYKACYSFLDRAYVRLEGNPETAVTVKMRQKPETSNEAFEAIAGEFENELLHQALRNRVTTANQKIREYIVTRALAAAEGVSLCQTKPTEQAQSQSVLDEDLEKEIEKLLAEVEKEGGDDPLKIAVPWEEKHPQPAASAEPANDTKGMPASQLAGMHGAKENDSAPGGDDANNL